MVKYKIGVDLGGTNIKAAILDENNNILAESKRKTNAAKGEDFVINGIAETVLDLCGNLGVDIKIIGKMGIGCPGAVDSKSGVVLFAGNLKGFKNLELTKKLEQKLGILVKLENDANCAALGEYIAGGAEEFESVLMITIGTGIGGGFVKDGKIYNGAGLAAAEFGHMALVSGGEQCSCGKKGCFEAYCSATSLIRDAKKAALLDKSSAMYSLVDGDIEKMNGRVPFEAYKMGDEVAKKLIEDYFYYLGDGITSIVNVMRPQIVLLSGGISGEKEVLTDPLTEFLKKYAFAKDEITPPVVKTATLGNKAGMVGAANL